MDPDMNIHSVEITDNPVSDIAMQPILALLNELCL
jgi:hypothetical protein